MSSKRPYRTAEYKHPTTFAEIVERANQEHQRRLAELKTASRMIEAIQPDLAALVAQRLYYSVDQHSMRLVDCAPLSASRKSWALEIHVGIFDEGKDRFVSALLARGWLVETADADRAFSKVILRRPKTQIRLRLGCSAAFASQLQVEPATEAA